MTADAFFIFPTKKFDKRKFVTYNKFYLHPRKQICLSKTQKLLNTCPPPLSEFASHLLTDFSELKSFEQISRAKKLNENCKKTCGGDVVCDHLTPGYFCGNVDSGVVMVNLNPGGDFETEYYQDFRKKLDDCAESELEVLVQEQIEENIAVTESVNRNAEIIEKGKRAGLHNIEPFDRKTAAFLLGFKDLEFEITDFTEEPDLTKTKADEKVFEAVKQALTQKFQLELIPYRSRRMDLDFAKISEHLVEYTNFIFDAILCKEREYVIFASGKFNALFKKYQKDGGEGLLYKFEKLSKPDKEKTHLHGEGFSFTPSVSCAVWRATRILDGKRTEFVVASTFPNKALPNAYKAMKKYGEFCEETLKKYK